MTVQMRDLKNGKPTGPIATMRRVKRRTSTVIHARELERTRPWFERLAALALLGLSFAGTIAMLNGGWGPTIAFRFGPGAVVAVGIQILCTYVEWAYARTSMAYLLAIMFDAVPTALGYAPLLLPTIYRGVALAQLTGQAADVVAWGIIGIAALLLAMAPETILVDSEPEGGQYGD